MAEIGRLEAPALVGLEAENMRFAGDAECSLEISPRSSTPSMPRLSRKRDRGRCSCPGTLARRSMELMAKSTVEAIGATRSVRWYSPRCSFARSSSSGERECVGL